MEHLLPQTLRDFKYYEQKLPLYLRNDEAFTEHFQIWYELLMGNGYDVAYNEFDGISPTSDLLLHLLNIFSETFLQDLQSLHNTGETSDLLDKLAELFGLKRNFSFDYYATSQSTTTTTASVNLTDEQLLLILHAQIIKNNNDGTYQLDAQYYEDAFRQFNLQIVSVNTEIDPATVNVYLNGVVDETSIYQQLFRGGFLTIEHLGIKYNYNVATIDDTLLWAVSNDAEANANKPYTRVWAEELIKYDGINGGIWTI